MTDKKPTEQDRLAMLVREVAIKAMGIATMYGERPEIKDLTAAIKLQAYTKDLAERVELVKAALEVRHSWLSQTVVPKLMEEAELTKCTVDGVGRVHLQDDVYVTILAENREKAHTWFGDNGFGDLIKSTINGSTLAAWVRRRLKSGEEMPEAVKVTPYTKAIITRATGEPTKKAAAEEAT